MTWAAYNIPVNQTNHEVIMYNRTYHTMNLDVDACCLDTEMPDLDPNENVEVHYFTTPSTPDVFYLPNGDPGYPGDPGELEVTEIWLKGKNIFDLVSEDIINHINIQVNEQHTDDDGDEYYED